MLKRIHRNELKFPSALRFVCMHSCVNVSECHDAHVDVRGQLLLCVPGQQAHKVPGILLHPSRFHEITEHAFPHRLSRSEGFQLGSSSCLGGESFTTPTHILNPLASLQLIQSQDFRGARKLDRLRF